MSEALAPSESLTEMLRIERRSDGRSSVRLESFWGATALGDLLARATLAGSSARGETPTATQTIFLRPVPSDVELTLACDVLSADRTRVRIYERDALVAEAQLRFGPAGDGLTYQSAAPEHLPSEAEVAAHEGWSPYAFGPIESRRLTPYLPVEDREPAVWLGWLRPRVPLGDDLRLHAAAHSSLGLHGRRCCGRGLRASADQHEAPARELERAAVEAAIPGHGLEAGRSDETQQLMQGTHAQGAGVLRPRAVRPHQTDAVGDHVSCQVPAVVAAHQLAARGRPPAHAVWARSVGRRRRGSGAPPPARAPRRA
jgi:hypothetical protein